MSSSWRPQGLQHTKASLSSTVSRTSLKSWHLRGAGTFLLRTVEPLQGISQRKEQLQGRWASTAPPRPWAPGLGAVSLSTEVLEAEWR